MCRTQSWGGWANQTVQSGASWSVEAQSSVSNALLQVYPSVSSSLRPSVPRQWLWPHQTAGSSGVIKSNYWGNLGIHLCFTSYIIPLPVDTSKNSSLNVKTKNLCPIDKTKNSCRFDVIDNTKNSYLMHKSKRTSQLTLFLSDIYFWYVLLKWNFIAELQSH